VEEKKKNKKWWMATIKEKRPQSFLYLSLSISLFFLRFPVDEENGRELESGTSEPPSLLPPTRHRQLI
jgi:hypothetical protein